MKINLRRIHTSPIVIPMMITLLSASSITAKQEAFTDSDAVARLKSTGQYKSLNKAIEAARYSIREFDAQKLWAKNVEHDLNATFDSNGLHLRIRNGSDKHYKSSWR